MMKNKTTETWKNSSKISAKILIRFVRSFTIYLFNEPPGFVLNTDNLFRYICLFCCSICTNQIPFCRRKGFSVTVPLSTLLFPSQYRILLDLLVSCRTFSLLVNLHSTRCVSVRTCVYMSVNVCVCVCVFMRVCMCVSLMCIFSLD